MASILFKARQGSRSTLTALYEANKHTACHLANVLLRNPEKAEAIAAQALQSALQEVLAGQISSKEAFSAAVTAQIARLSREAVQKQDPRAFAVPLRKDSPISMAPSPFPDPHATPLKPYLDHLPDLHRFLLILRHGADLEPSAICACMDLESAALDQALEAEPDNLSRIYRAAKSADIPCIPPTHQMLRNAFREAAAQAPVPPTMDTQLLAYIDSVSGNAGFPLPAKAAIALGAAGILLLWLLLPAGKTPPDTQTTTAETTQAPVETLPEQTEYSMPFDHVEVKKEVPGSETAYYADICIADHGTITVALDPEAAPRTVENFISLAESGFYDGLTFHRIMEDFMMQGGDPNGDGTGGSEKTIRGEFADNGVQNPLSHTRGVISMARSSDYNSASSQFFIVHEDSTFLDGQYAAFGCVTEGMEIVDAICTAAEPTDSNGTIPPEDQPVITSVRIRRQTTGGAIVGQVKEMGVDGTLLLHLHEPVTGDHIITDYAAVDLSRYAYAFDTMTYTLSDDTVILTPVAGVLTETTPMALLVGDMVVIYRDNGTEHMVIYPQPLAQWE